MNDIVKRLREYRIATDPDRPIHPPICEEAAKEIERLMGGLELAAEQHLQNLLDADSNAADTKRAGDRQKSAEHKLAGQIEDNVELIRTLQRYKRAIEAARKLSWHDHAADKRKNLPPCAELFILDSALAEIGQ